MLLKVIMKDKENKFLQAVSPESRTGAVKLPCRGSWLSWRQSPPALLSGSGGARPHENRRGKAVAGLLAGGLVRSPECLAGLTQRTFLECSVHLCAWCWPKTESFGSVNSSLPPPVHRSWAGAASEDGSGARATQLCSPVCSCHLAHAGDVNTFLLLSLCSCFKQST